MERSGSSPLGAAPHRGPRTAPLLASKGMSSSLTQCWFCHSLNITVPDSPTPCHVCGVLPKHARPDTSAVVMSPQQHAALVAQVAATSGGAIVSGHQELTAAATLGVPAPCDDATSVLVKNAPAVATSTPAGRWVIETEVGDIVPLPSGDVVVGRQPTAIEGAVPVVLADVAKTLSKSHARLRYDATAAPGQSKT